MHTCATIYKLWYLKKYKTLGFGLHYKYIRIDKKGDYKYKLILFEKRKKKYKYEYIWVDKKGQYKYEHNYLDWYL